MARNESDREDLFAEAIQLVTRIEWQHVANKDPVIAGFRENGWCSLYLSADRMWQWDANVCLRRAFIDGRLYRTQGTTLAKLVRHRTVDATTLLRDDLGAAELDDFVQSMQAQIQSFLDSQRTQSLKVVRVIEQGVDVGLVPARSVLVIERVLTFLQAGREGPVKLAPVIPGKR